MIPGIAALPDCLPLLPLVVGQNVERALGTSRQPTPCLAAQGRADRKFGIPQKARPLLVT
jgi:hypothetical protein